MNSAHVAARAWTDAYRLGSLALIPTVRDNTAFRIIPPDNVEVGIQRSSSGSGARMQLP